MEALGRQAWAQGDTRARVAPTVSLGEVTAAAPSSGGF